MMSDSGESVEISSSSVELSSESEKEAKTPVPTKKRRRYKRSIHHGHTEKQARYYEVQSSSSVRQLPAGRTDCGILCERSCDSPEVTVSDSSPVFSDSSPSLSDTTSLSDSAEDSQPDGPHEPSCNTEFKTTPLYDGSHHTVFTAYALVMLYVMKHSLSRQAFSDLLVLIESLLPTSNFTTSVYRIKDVLKKCISYREPVVHSYCGHCQMVLQNGCSCEKDVCKRNKSKPVQFLDLKLNEQLADFFQGKLLIFFFLLTML